MAKPVRVSAKHQRAVDADVRRAVSAWQRGRFNPKHFTGRTDAENRRQRERALKALDQILNDPRLSRDERAALERTDGPHRKAVKSIFAESRQDLLQLAQGVRSVGGLLARLSSNSGQSQPSKLVANRPLSRKEGYDILVQAVRTLQRNGVPKENSAVRYVVNRLLALYPPDKVRPWLYNVNDQNARATLEDARDALENRLSAHISQRR